MAGAIILSQVQSLNFLRIEPMPTRPLKNATVVRVPGSDVVVAIDDKGTIYSSQVEGGRKSWNDLENGRCRSTIDGLIKLGALSRKAIAQHQAIVKAEREKSEAKYSARYMLEYSKRLGVKLTNAQMGKVERALGGGDKARALIEEILNRAEAGHG